MRRFLFGIGGVALAATLGLTSCGSEPTAATATTIRVGATNFVTLPPTQSTNPPITSAGLIPGTIREVESTYTIVTNDYPSTVASRFNVKFEDLLSINGWTLVDGLVPEWPGVGEVINIPAGATEPGEPVAVASGVTVAGTAAPVTAAPVTTVKICASETYVIAAGDVPSLVAERFGVTINDLNTVNGGTPGFAGFVVGITIKIPDKTQDC